MTPDVPIRVSGLLDAIVEVPGSKSVSNRALVLAALADGPSTLSGVPEGDDVTAMIAGLRSLGAQLDLSDRKVVVRSGITLADASPVVIDAGLAGTTSRFLLAAAALRTGKTEIVGRARLSSRPFGELIESLRSLGAFVEGGPGLPLTVSRSTLRGGSVSLSGEVSSQFLSALMMIGPLVAGGMRIDWTGRLVSRPYLEMTANVMESFGVDCSVGSQEVVVAPGRYHGRDYEIEIDASSAGYPAAAAAIAGGRVRIRRAASVRLQSDRMIFDILSTMGCSVKILDDDIEVKRDGGNLLLAVDVDLREASDLVPTVAVLGCVARGTTRIRGVGFVRHKESDRIGELAVELRKFGAVVDEHPDGLDITGSPLTAAVVDPHDDHRLAMALSLLGLVAPGTRVADPGVVGKSWPGYFESMDRW